VGASTKLFESMSFVNTSVKNQVLIGFLPTLCFFYNSSVFKESLPTTYAHTRFSTRRDSNLVICNEVLGKNY